MRQWLFLIPILLLAACDQQSKENAEASQAKQRALDLATDVKKSGHPARAAEIYRQMLAQGDSAEAAIGLAGIYRKQGRGAEAVEVMRQADARTPGNPLVLAQLGYALIAAKEQEEAVNVFDTLIAMEPDNAMAYNGKGVAFDSAGNHVAAQELYQKALSLDPETASIRNNLAMSLILNDQSGEAIALLEPVVARPDATAAIRQNLALAYGLEGDFDRARELNLKDVTPEQAEENLRFYRHYAERKRTHAASGSKEKMEPSLSDLFDPDGTSTTKPVMLIKEGTPIEAAPAAGKKAPKEERPIEPESDAPEETESNAEEGGPFGKDAVYNFPGE